MRRLQHKIQTGKYVKEPKNCKDTSDSCLSLSLIHLAVLDSLCCVGSGCTPWSGTSPEVRGAKCGGLREMDSRAASLEMPADQEGPRREMTS